MSRDKASDVNTGGENYRAFLLRCWQEPGAGLEGKPAWRFALVGAGDESVKRGFASLEELIVFLREDLDSYSEATSGGGVL